ncbi:MAG TPA: hypothetical protein VGM20_07745 [Gemmatimonadales bacterium]|jgi:hypothetical protein
MTDAPQQVFLNVPFDLRYRKLFRAIVFAVHECGLVSRCALEKEDAGEARFAKIIQIIGESRFGIHDLSRTTLDGAHRLPRFNMPLELGLFLGARHYGKPAHRNKACLILDREPYRYQIYCSDIAGQDIRTHHNEVGQALGAVRNWLRTQLPHRPRLPGPAAIAHRYIAFQRQLPALCKEVQLTQREMSFLDYRLFVEEWIEAHPGIVNR